MKKYKFVSTWAVAFLLLSAFGFSAFANSSWVWISETRPYDVFPFVVAGTLAIETAAYNLFLKVGNWHKVFFGVLAGNLVSFVVPYMGYANTTPYAGVYTLKEILNRGPFYTVGTAFLLLTVIIEVPFMCFYLRKDAKDKKLTVAVAVLVNVVTTVLVALTERLLCHGHW